MQNIIYALGDLLAKHDRAVNQSIAANPVIIKINNETVNAPANHFAVLRQIDLESVLMGAVSLMLLDNSILVVSLENVNYIINNIPILSVTAAKKSSLRFDLYRFA
jgi:hypothetical protein